VRKTTKRASEPAELVQGIRAGLAVFSRRRDDIQRVAFTRAVRPEVEELARWAASRPMECVEVGEREIDHLAGSTHHEGLLLTCRPRRWGSLQELGDVLSRSKGTAIALERVRNPYNVGAILRTAAFFGVDAVLLGAPAPDPGLPALAVRVAEGGAEHLLLTRTTDLAETLSRLRAVGVSVVGADAGARISAFGFSWPRPSILVVGHEREGLGPRVRSHCDAMVSIPRAGRVDSLNVSTAAGVLISQMLASR
jgi:RNA methyltransferase, TrmH family